MSDLDILNNLSNEELEVIVRLIIDEGGLTEQLTDSDDYKRYKPNHRMYIDAIKEEIIKYGSNTFFFNNSYKEIVCNVCDKLDVPYNASRSLEHIEHNLLEKVLEKAWDEMSPSERQEVLGTINKGDKILPQATAVALIGLFRAGGFASYQLAVVIANCIAKNVVGQGLSLAANATLTRALSIFTGPIGIALTALWTVFSFAGPAYRVIIPFTVYISCMRFAYNNKKLAEKYF